MLKDKSTNTELLVVIFQLVPTEEAVKEGAKGPEEQFEETHKGEAKSDAKEKADESKAGGDDDELD